MPEARPSIKSSRAASYRQESPAGDYGDHARPRPNLSRSTTFEAQASRHDTSPAPGPHLARMPSDSLTIRTTKSQLRTVDFPAIDQDVFHDDSTFYTNSSPDYSYGDRSVSPATSHGSTGVIPITSLGKKGPPPPPPSRGKKPPPPPPPAKRTLIT
jgi:hypothetical protein